ncbi:MAG: elongation factor P [Clostridia bacterium]|nr:elongation factor P [Clostridia bacterium]
MVVAGDFRNGITFDMGDGQVWQVVEFQHVKPGKGAAFVRTKIKNVKTGSVIERTFNPTDKFQDARVERKEMQYLYEDGGLYYFMDMETYEQLPVDGSKLSDNFKYVKENEMCKIVSYQGDIFGVEPPTFVVLEISDTEPGVRGDTATGASKTATLETGATIRVPLFVNTGDMIRVDTRTGEYLERA